MHALAITIDYYYWKYDCKCHYAKQAKKKAFKFYFQKKSKASSICKFVAFQSKAKTSLIALFTKSLSSKLLSPTLKKQSNSLQVDLSFKLTSNSKLTSDKCKKHLENNLYLYCNAEDHKLDFCSKKQTTVTSKGYGTSATANPLVAASKKLLENQRVTSKTSHRLRATLNFPVQQ